MKVRVISLVKRADRKQHFCAANANKIEAHFTEAIDGEFVSFRDLDEWCVGFDMNWRDPIHNRRMTKGEVGCFLSHLNLWDECGSGQDVYLILEDDFIARETIDLDRVEGAAKKHGCVYLSYLEMDKSFVPNSPSEGLVEVSYPYWALAYAITPEVARTLAIQARLRIISPVDELMPVVNKMMMSKGKGWVAFEPALGYPRDKAEGQSNIDPSHDTDYFVYGDLRVFTVATDQSMAFRLTHSCEDREIRINVLGEGVNWSGGDMAVTGGAHKISLLREAIDKLPNNDIVAFSDGYDSFFVRGHKCGEELVGRYLSMGSDIVFSGEKHCWPDAFLASLYKTSGEYPYLNSGGFIGSVLGIKNLIDAMGLFANSDDDQRLYTREYLYGDHDIKIDVEGYIFQTSDDRIVLSENKIYNTECCPIVFHGNGSEHEKVQMHKYFQEMYPEYGSALQYKIAAKDMLQTTFLSKEECDELIALAEEYGEWGSLKYDKFPAQEIRLSLFSPKYYERICEMVHGRITEIAEEYWHPLMMYGVRDVFVMKYNLSGQTSLGLHHDASLVTGSVKLNSDYKGAELSFPRQGFTNEDVPVGDIILFPGQVTHGHRCEELEGGTKYSLTIWTRRWEGDTM
jgi:GR25 family glycosyltransferase involved in LPS biosynthesis